MGGAVVVRSCPRLQEKQYRITGVCVLDVVEGSAVDALPHMHSLLNARPDGFGSIEEAIEWQYVGTTPVLYSSVTVFRTACPLTQLLTRHRRVYQSHQRSVPLTRARYTHTHGAHRCAPRRRIGSVRSLPFGCERNQLSFS